MLTKSLPAGLSAVLIVTGLPFGTVLTFAGMTQAPGARMAAAPSVNTILPPLPSAAAAALPAALEAVNAPKASAETGLAALNTIYEGNRRVATRGPEAPIAAATPAGSALSAPSARSTRRSSAIDTSRSHDGGLLAEVSKTGGKLTPFVAAIFALSVGMMLYNPSTAVGISAVLMILSVTDSRNDTMPGFAASQRDKFLVMSAGMTIAIVGAYMFGMPLPLWGLAAPALALAGAGLHHLGDIVIKP